MPEKYRKARDYHLLSYYPKITSVSFLVYFFIGPFFFKFLVFFTKNRIFYIVGSP